MKNPKNLSREDTYSSISPKSYSDIEEAVEYERLKSLFFAADLIEELMVDGEKSPSQVVGELEWVIAMETDLEPWEVSESSQEGSE
jgi:hypothetical protein